MVDFLADLRPEPSPNPAARRIVLEALRRGDHIFRSLTQLSAFLVLILLGAIFLSLIAGGFEAFKTFGFSFITTEVWNPVTEQFGALAPIYGTIVTSAHRHAHRRPHQHWHCSIPDGALRDAAAPADRHSH